MWTVQCKILHILSRQLFFLLTYSLKGPLTSIFIVHVYDRNENLCSLPFMYFPPLFSFGHLQKLTILPFIHFALGRKNILFVTQISIYKLPKMELTTGKNYILHYRIYCYVYKTPKPQQQ